MGHGRSGAALVESWGELTGQERGRMFVHDDDLLILSERTDDLPESAGVK